MLLCNSVRPAECGLVVSEAVRGRVLFDVNLGALDGLGLHVMGWDDRFVMIELDFLLELFPNWPVEASIVVPKEA